MMKCPACGGTAEYPTVDIGVGEQQCGPAHCLDCGWHEDHLAESDHLFNEEDSPEIDEDPW